MSAKHKLDQQLNFRLTSEEKHRLAQIAIAEDREISQIVRALVRLGLSVYEVIPSIRALQLANIPELITSMDSDTVTARTVPASIAEGLTKTRLSLRTEAAKQYETERATKNPRDRKQG